MIPKVIHYCWFGRNPLPDSALKCIASWRKYLPDYEIKEWNEDNFDVNIIPYTQQAYEAKKYAFVSDYARFWILYHYGGLYFDTDVEVIRPMDEIVKRGPFMGLEKLQKEAKEPAVAPGLGLGAPVGHQLYAELLNIYARLQFTKTDGTPNLKTIVEYTTELLQKKGLQRGDGVQQVDGVFIYPEDYFCPMDSTTGITTITPRTVSIHHYDCSWLDHNSMHFRLHLLKNTMNRILHKLGLK